MTDSLRPVRLSPPTPGLLAQLADIVGKENALTDPSQQAPYLVEWRDRYHGRTPVVLRPGSTGEVARILALCNEAGVGVVPQAGNTGLVGGQIPSAEGDEILLSVARLQRIRALDPDAGVLTAEAGVTLAEARSAARDAGRLFPLSLASEGSCRIGGNLATNAGGTAVLAYGSARRLTLGLEVVLADGRVWDGLRALEKDNTGYDLRDLFIGSEGTLGVITAATLRLVPRPRDEAVAIVGLRSLDDVLPLFRRAEARCGSCLTAFELISERALAFALKHVPGTRPPLGATYPWLVLLEIASGEEGRAALLVEGFLSEAHGAGLVADAALARSLSQAADLWHLRESLSEAQKGEGGSIKHDISVPVARIPEFLRRGAALVEEIAPGARPVPFGHFGDGNIHYNVSQPEGADPTRFLALWDVMQERIHDLVTEMGGSISAEHGIGVMKRAALAKARGPVELDMMRAVKRALDPKGILNPGKVL